MNGPIGVSVPPLYRRAFADLATISPEAAEKLLDAVATGLITSRSTFTAELARTDGAALDAAGLVDALLALAALRRDAEQDPSQIAELISASRDLALEEPERDLLKDRLTRLLRTPTVSLLTRAYDLATEHAATFIDTRIVSDIRPVFLDDPPKQPSAAIVTQTLKIEFLTTERESIYIALQDEDLVTLQKVIDKAMKKREQLELMIRSTDTPFVNLSDK